jgi:superfamily I DNA/RNA helicase
VSRWCENLNPEQRQAVLHDYGPLLILAGAGSGKTTVLVSRAGRLIEEGIAPANQLCVLTFTNKAARELKARVAKKLGSRGDKIWAGTFHSFGLFLLRKHYKKARLAQQFGVMDTSDAGSLLKELLRDFDNGKAAYDAETLLSMMSDWRAKGQTKAQADTEYDEAVEWLLPRYLKRLEHLAAVDFDSLILRPVELMDEFPEVKEEVQSSFCQVMVDEFQDTNESQMALTRRLAESHKNLAVVGDDDQSIYGWRGACVENILHFPRHYPGCQVVRLERNYRSSPQILEVANYVISKNTERHKKILRPTQADAGKPEVMIFQDETEEAELVCAEVNYFIGQGHAKKEIALLYRSNSLGASLEAELRKNQIPYSMSGGTAFFDRKETRDVLAYLRCGLKPNDVAFRRVFNTPPRGIGEKTIDELIDRVSHGNTSFVRAAREWRAHGLEPRAGNAIDAFFGQIEGLVPQILGNETATVGQNLQSFLVSIGYKAYLEKTSPEASQAARRWKHLEIFADVLDRFVQTGGRNVETLKDFIDKMELRDPVEEKDEDRVQLLTLHACKGLEFPVVILLGVEEDMLPHKTLGNDVAEERRLFYVGVTRAERHLILGRTLRRKKFGKHVETVPSRFLVEIPETMLSKREGLRPVNENRRKAMLADLFKKLDAPQTPAVPSPSAEISD